MESVDNVNFEIPVPEAVQCDPGDVGEPSLRMCFSDRIEWNMCSCLIGLEFRPVTEEQILNSVKWTELDWKEAVIRLSKKLAEKRVFGPMLMARATVAGTNHSNYPNLPIQGIIYIESGFFSPCIYNSTYCDAMCRYSVGCNAELDRIVYSSE